MMSEIKSHLDEELKGVADYFSLYFEYMNSDISKDFYKFALDELEHVEFWLDMLEVEDDDEYEYYKEQYEELKSLMKEGEKDD